MVIEGDTDEDKEDVDAIVTSVEVSEEMSSKILMQSLLIQ